MLLLLSGKKNVYILVYTLRTLMPRWASSSL